MENWQVGCFQLLLAHALQKLIRATVDDSVEELVASLRFAMQRRSSRLVIGAIAGIVRHDQPDALGIRGRNRFRFTDRNAMAM